MNARIEYWVLGDVKRDMLKRWCLYYWRNGTKCKRPIKHKRAMPTSQELLDTVAAIIGRKLTRCEETDVLSKVKIN